MKKVSAVGLSLLLCLALVACGSKSLESDIGKEKASIIEKNIEEMKQYYIDNAKYQSGNKDEGSGTYTFGDCEFVLYTDGKTVTKASATDKAPDGNSSSEGFKNVMNSIIYLKALNLDTDTMSKLVDIWNKRTDETVEKNINGYIIVFTKTSITINNKTDESLTAAIPVTLDDIEMVNFKCLPPNSIGTIYMQTKFKNNSDKVLKSIQYTYSFDDESHYLSCYDTLLPGETSVIVDTFGPKSKDLKDAVLVKASWTVVEDGEDVYVDYDAKLKQYSWY